jgi:hypothetical protein
LPSKENQKSRRRLIPDFFYNVPPYKHKITEDVALGKGFEMCRLEAIWIDQEMTTGSPKQKPEAN